MTTKRLVILLLVLVAGLSTVFALPKQLLYQPLGIEMELPEYIGEWWGQSLAVTEQEIVVLGEGPSRNEIEALARLRGLSSRVRFMGMPRHPEDVRERIAGPRQSN